MPYYNSTAGKSECKIYYEVRGDLSREEGQECSTSGKQRPNVVLIMGFGATHGCWAPQLEELLGRKQPTDPPRARVLLLDNRGVGRSDSPKSKKAYSTSIMATDVICILDHLGWGKVHLIGHSMGAMIASKIAVLDPHRVESLLLISPTGGGFQALPQSFTCFKICLQIALTKSRSKRAWLDLQLHFNRKMLNTVDRRYGRTLEELLQEDYLEGSEGGGPGQPGHGFKGQVHAVWTHSLPSKEIQIIKDANIPTMVIHGRHDLLAMPHCGEALARKLEAPCVMLEGAHMLCRERGPEVNLLIHRHIFHGRRLKDTQHRFLIEDPSSPLEQQLLETKPCMDAASHSSSASSSAASHLPFISS